MSEKLNELIRILRLEQIEQYIFRGQSQDPGWGRIFGGQVLGQALSAAEQTVSSDRQVHSLHSYFLRQGDASKPVVFIVDPIRDGRSFSTRRVVAWQDGKAIFNLSASFQIQEQGFEHQRPTMPEVPGPDNLPSERDLAEKYLHTLDEQQRNALPEALRTRIVSERPIEIRPVGFVDPVRPKPSEAIRQSWFRANGSLPDQRSLHHYLLAYASDFYFFVTALQPHGAGWMSRSMQVASIDHAMWFHREFRFDDWLLYDVDAPTAQSARGLVSGRWFDRKGNLVASCMQEGLMRQRQKA